MSSRHSDFFSHHLFNSCHLFYHLHLPTSLQGKCHLGIQYLSPHHYLHSFHHFYNLHFAQFQQGECHQDIRPLLPHLIFLLSSLLLITPSSISKVEVSSGHSGSLSSSYFLFLSSFISFTPSSLSIREVSYDNYASLVFILDGYTILGSVAFLFLC